MVGKNLGLPFSKQGTKVLDVDGNSSSKTKSSGAVNTTAISTDAEYRAAYLNIREQNKSLLRADITDGMVQKRIQKIKGLRGS